MGSVPLPDNETERLQLLHELDLLDSGSDELLDRITRLVKELFAADIALISLVDEHRQWFKSKVGFAEPETPRNISFCTHVVATGETLLVDDATQDPRFVDNPLVTAENGIRSYVGAPLTLYDEYHLGTLCVISSKTNHFPAGTKRVLELLADWVSTTITDHYELNNYLAERDVLAQGPVCAVVWRIEPKVQLSYVADNAIRVLGYEPAYLLRDDVSYESIVHPDDREELLARMQRLIDGEQAYLEMDYRVLLPEPKAQGSRWVHHFARADHDKQGNVIRIRGYLLDDSKGKNLELELLESNKNFELALAAGEFFTWSWFIPDDQLMVSHAWSLLLGYDAQKEDEIDWQSLLHPDDKNALRTQLKAHLHGDTERFDVRFRLRHVDGHYVWIHSVGRLVERAHDGKPVRMSGIHHDISAQVENEASLAQQTAVLELVSHVQHEFMLAKNFSDVTDYALPKLMQMTASAFGLVGELPPQSRRRDMLQIHGLEVLGEDNANSEYHKLIQQGLEVVVSGDVVRNVLLRGEPEFCHLPVSRLEMSFTPVTIPELRNAMVLPLYFKHDVVGLLVLGNSSEGYLRWHLNLLRPMLDTLGTLMHMRRLDEERQYALEELRRMASVDELTGVANRRVFWHAMEERYEEFMRYQVAMSVAVIDLDHFKSVNDTYGHAAGDEVLREFAKRCKAQLRDLDLIGRLGGEEFAVLLPYSDVTEASKAIERLREHVAATPVTHDDKQIAISFSAGVTQLRSTDAKLDDWMARADEALYQAKESGRNQTVVVPEPN